MGKGRKKMPTALKKMQGTNEKSREVDNEMQVDLCSSLPDAPDLLSEIGKGEWLKVTQHQERKFWKQFQKCQLWIWWN